MPAHRTQNSRHLRVDAAPSIAAPPINVISPTPRAFFFPPDTESNSADVSYAFTSQLHPSHSLPNLLASDPSLNSGTDSSWNDAQSSTGSHTSMFSSYSDSSSASFFGSSFTSPATSLYGSSSYESSPPDTSSTPPHSLSPSPPPVDDRITSSSPAPYPLPLPRHSNGQVRTQPPRPPNPWICFRNVRSAQYRSSGEFPKLAKKGRGASAPSSPSAGPIALDGEARRPRQADLSKHISLEWKALTDEERAPYVRMSEEAKIIHARVYPGYKYQPRRKADGGPDAKKGGGAKAKKAAAKKTEKGRQKPSEKAGAGEHSPKRLAPPPPPPDSIGPVAIQLPVLDLGIMQQGQDAAGGDQPKEWTWLPEQTLLPLSWELDSDQITVDDVMHQLDANVDEQGEHCDGVFQEPFYLSFPPVDASDTAAPPPFFFPFNETQGGTADFADPNYEFPGSSSALGLQDGLLEDGSGFSQPLEAALAGSFGAALLNDCLTDPEPSPTLDNGEGGHMDNKLANPKQPFSSVQDIFMSLPQFDARHPPRQARRGSVPAYSDSISSDGHLRPPNVSQVRHPGRSRRSSVPTLKFSSSSSSSLDPRQSDAHDMRSIQTSTFGGNSGITTSILIPKTVQSYNTDLERDLADYSRALSSIIEPKTPTAAKSPTDPVPPTSVAAAEGGAAAAAAGGELDFLKTTMTTTVTPKDDNDDNIPTFGFDFDIEFSDIIDLHGSRDQLT